MKNKEELAAALKEHLEYYPLDTKEFLDICSNNIERFMRAKEVAQDRLAARSIEGLLYTFKVKKLKPNDIVLMIDALAYHLPGGWDSLQGHSPAMQSVFLRFLELAEEFNLMGEKNRYWLNSIKGHLKWAESIFHHPFYSKFKEKLANNTFDGPTYDEALLKK